MDSDQVVRIALTFATPILTALLGIVVLVIGDWRERRTQAGRRKVAFEDASRQVAFAAEWWNASKLVADHSPDAEQRAATRAQAWLDEASALIAESHPPPVDEKPDITLRRLLLAFPMQRRAARVLRGVFYFCLGLVVFQVSSAMGAALGRSDTLGIPNYFSGGFIYGDLIAVCVLMVVAMAFRFSALHVERSGPTAPNRRLTLRSALLLYRFKRPVAAIARVVFWVWTAFTILDAVIILVTAFDDPRLIPANLVGLAAFVGWAFGLRYWAVSLDARTPAQRRVAAGEAASVIPNAPPASTLPDDPASSPVVPARPDEMPEV
jgi:hypothetical protein